ncbi:MAG: hypothetical protein IJQ36_06445 [Oscillospiraceae bacterium]|nr:hypothetical protein [Oscillospiraceae bacterium]
MRKRTALMLALLLCVALALPGMTASAENIGTYPVGEEMGWIEFYRSSLPIESCILSSGYLPAGVQVIAEEYAVYITGIPETTGNFVAEYLVMTTEAVDSAYLSFTVSSAPTPAPATQDIVITKSPTGEHVEAGGSAKFVARANNAERIVWRLVSNDTTNTVQCTEAGEFFPGIQVSGLGTETLVLSNIPKSLDGWRVEAQFWNGNRHAESNGAEITIVDDSGNPIRNQLVAAAATPVPEPAFTFAPSVGSNDMPVSTEARTANISIQPMSRELLPGEGYTLSVIATSPNNGTLSYQWYSAATNNRSAALPISGASEASYTVNQNDGTAYYWVAVWNTKDGARSQAVYSEPAEVRITVPATPTPIPTPTPTPTPAPRQSAPSNISFQLILFGIIGVLALIALIGVVIYLRADARQRAEEAAQERKNKKG